MENCIHRDEKVDVELYMAKSIAGTPKGTIIEPTLFFKNFWTPDQKKTSNLHSLMRQGRFYIGHGRKSRHVFVKRVRVDILHPFDKRYLLKPAFHIAVLPVLFLAFEDVDYKGLFWSGHLEGSENIETFLKHLREV